MYDQLLKKLKSSEIKEEKKNGAPTKIKATLLQIASSQEWQTSIPETEDFPETSLFTGVFMMMTGDKNLKTYSALINKTKKKMPHYQTPKHQILGSKTIKISAQQPFKI